MLEFELKETEFWDPVLEEFVVVEPQTLELEHSLYSISKWEEKTKKPFLTADEKTLDDLILYVQCMALPKKIDSTVARLVLTKHSQEFQQYLEDPMTATTFHEDNSRHNREIVTAELVYYWMTAAQIPFETQYWHINKLMTLIRIAGIKSQPPKKMGKHGTMKSNAAINAARRAKLGSAG